MIELYRNTQLPLTYSTRDSELGDYPLVHGSLHFRDFEDGEETVREIVVVFIAFVRDGSMPESGLLPFFAPILLEFSKSLKRVIYEDTYSERGVYYAYSPSVDSQYSFNRTPLVTRFSLLPHIAD